MTPKKEDFEFEEKEFREDIKKIKKMPEARKIAEEEGVYIGDNKWHEFLYAFFIITLIIGIVGFLYLAYGGKFQSIQEVLLNPEYNITTINDYNNTFTNDIDNTYEHRVYINQTNYINNFINCTG